MADFYFGDDAPEQNTSLFQQTDEDQERQEPWRVDVEAAQPNAFHFGQAEERQQSLMNLKQAVKGVDPRHVSSAFEVARKTGINPNVALVDPERFRAELDATPAWQKLMEAEATQSHLSNPLMMAASQEDINTLTDVERLQAALSAAGARRVMREKSAQQAVDDWYSGYTEDVELGFWHMIGGSIVEGFKKNARAIDYYFAAGGEQLSGNIQAALQGVGYTPEQVEAYLEKGEALPRLAEGDYKGELPWYIDPGSRGEDIYDNHDNTMRARIDALNSFAIPRYLYNFSKWVAEESREELDPEHFIGGAIQPDVEFQQKVAKKGGIYQFASDTMHGITSMANMMLFSLMGAPEVGVGLMYAQIAGGDIEKGEREGVDPAVNWRAANWDAFLQTPLEAIGVSRALKVWQPQKLLGKRFKAYMESVLTEGITEGLQSIPEELADLYRKSNAEDITEVQGFFKSLCTEEFLKKAGYQSAVGAFSAGLLGGPKMGYSAVFSRDEGANDPVRALKQGIESLKASRESKDVLEHFTGEMVKAGKLPETVYLPARSVAAMFQEEKLPDKMNDFLDSLDVDRAEFQAALETDGEIQIDGAKLGPLVGGEYGNQLESMITLNPVEREAAEVVKSIAHGLGEGQSIEEAAITAAELAAAEQALKEPIADSSPYRERIRQDLQQVAGLSPTQAEAYAALVDANAQIWSSLPGESIDSYYERYGYRMQKTDFGESLAQVYDAYGQALGASSEVEFFNRYHQDEAFKERVNGLLTFGEPVAPETQANNPFVINAESLLDVDVAEVLNSADRIGELLSGGHDSIQVNIGEQSFVLPLSEGVADAPQAMAMQEGAQEEQGPAKTVVGPEVLFQPINPGVNPNTQVEVVDLSNVKPFQKINGPTSKKFVKQWKGVPLKVRVNNNGEWEISLFKKDSDHAFWSGRNGIARYLPSRRRALAALDKVLEGTVLVESYPNTKQTGKKADVETVHRFYVPVASGGKVDLLRIVAFEKKGTAPEIDGVELYDVITEHPRPAALKGGATGGGVPYGRQSSVGAMAGSSGAHQGPAAAPTLKIDIRTLLKGVKDAKGKPYFQSGAVPRGAHTVASDSQSIIHFFEASDISTAGHEIFHVFRRVMGDMAAHPQAPDWVQQDWATACEFVGATPGETWTREQEEKWAEAGEAYLLEGKAPSSALRGAFSTLRRWMLNIYRSVLSLGGKVAPQMRDVFDRMLATEQEIGEARANMDTKPIFEGPELGDMAQEYAEWARKASLASDPEVQQRTEAERKILLPKWKKLAGIFAAEHESQKLIASIIEAGGFGLQPLKNMSINEDVIKTLKKLHGKKIVTAGGGSPDDFSQQFGFNTPEELISHVLEIPTKAQLAEGRLQELEDEWRQTWDPEVVIMTEHYEKLMEMEADILAAVQQGQALKGAAVKKVVRQRTGQTRVGRIQMTEMEALKSVIRREAAAARMAYRAGKQEEALAAKERQRKAIAELKSKNAAKEEIRKTLGYLKRVGRATTKGKAMTADANAQILSILEGFDLRKSVSQAELDRRGHLSAWAMAQEEQGKVVDLPDSVLRDIGRVHYKQMSLDDLRALVGTIKNIETIGRAEKKMLSTQKKMERSEVVGGLIRSVENNYDGKIQPAKVDYDETIKRRIGKGLGGLNAGLMKVLFMCDRLDGGETGWWTTHIYKPISEAVDRASVWKGKANVQLGEMMEAHYSKKDLSRMRKDRIHINKNVGFLTREQILSVALNAGNAYNLNAVKEGSGWSDQDIRDILAQVQDRDWDYAQNTWDYLDAEFWPGISELYRELTGNEPKKVKGQSFTTPTGKKVKGGYYPLKAKADASVRAHQIEEASTVQEMFGGLSMGVYTQNGHTKARTDFGKQPVDLSLSVLFNHVSAVITDLAMRKEVIDVNWLLNNKKVADIVSRTLGIEAHGQMKKWLAASAGSGRQGESIGLDRFAALARKNKTVAAMAFKVTTFTSQFAGFFNSIGLVGASNVASGLAKVARNPVAAYSFIEDNSTYMADRRNNFDRELLDRAKKLGRKGTFDKITEYGFYHIREADFFVSAATWHAAYNKALESGKDHKGAVWEGDKAVQMSQGGGRAPDLAAVQRGGEWRKLFTMFYTFFSTQYNQFTKMYYDVRRTGNVGQFTARTFWLWFAPAIVSEILAGRGPDDDENWAAWAAKETAVYPFMTVPGLREVVQSFYSDYGAQKTVFGETGETAKWLYKEATDGDDDSLALFKKALRFSGYLVPLPTAQTDITIGQFVEYLTGEKKDYGPRDLFYRDRR